MNGDLTTLKAEALIQTPALLLITGKSGFGKTSQAVKLYLKRFAHVVDRTYMICPSFESQEVFDPMREFVSSVITEPTEKTFTNIRDNIISNNAKFAAQDKPKPKWFLFIDDLGGLPFMNNGRIGAFANLANQMRPLGISCMVITQQATSISAAYRDNVTGVLSFPETRAKAKQWLHEEYGMSIPRNFFYEMVEKGWSGGKDKDEWGEHFLFIHCPFRKPPSYYVDFEFKLPYQRGNYLPEKEET